MFKEELSRFRRRSFSGGSSAGAACRQEAWLGLLDLPSARLYAGGSSVGWIMEQSSSANEFREQRLANLNRLEAMGYTPFGRVFERSGRIGDIRDAFEEGKNVRMAGRIVSKREMGKSIFAHLHDHSGRFQVYVRRDAVGEDAFAAFQILDLGDQIGVEGALFTTKKGEPSVKVDVWRLLSKSLLPLPEKWHGLQDVDLRYRKRYLDLIANPGVGELFKKRAQAIRVMRDMLSDRGYFEVETPMIQPVAGGAAANPFKTHFDVLGVDMFLRIAPELYLKRLLIGGYDKVYELNRNFRNEGLSRFHNPEFTMLEIYEAYGNVRTMMTLIQELITHTAREVFGGLSFGEGEQAVDLTPPWKEVPYKELIRTEAGGDWFDLPVDDMRRRAESLGVPVAPDWSAVEVTQEIFEKRVEKNMADPIFVTRMPVELVPLARACEDDPSVVDVFELVIAGREIAPGYTELNDPMEQRRRFEAQAGGDAAKIDEDFLTALEHGMPPAGGMGIGIDRLLMVLTGSEAIRDVILFPQLKPKER